MHSKTAQLKFQAINNRILVRNSHKFVYKKLCSIDKNQWCQKYLSVATSKLLDPKNTTKLPFSLNKKIRTQNNNVNLNTSQTNLMQKRKCSQVLAINQNQDLAKSRTVDHEQLINASKKAERLLERMRKTVFKKNSLKGIQKNQKIMYKSPKKYRSKDQFQIEPWMVDNQDIEDKQNNRFF